jgi:hypothetical protein
MRNVFITTNTTVTVNYTLDHHPQLGQYFTHDVHQTSTCTTKHWLQTFRLLSNLAVCQISDRTALLSDTWVGHKTVELLQRYSDVLNCWTATEVQRCVELLNCYRGTAMCWTVELLQRYSDLLNCWTATEVQRFVELLNCYRGTAICFLTPGAATGLNWLMENAIYTKFRGNRLTGWDVWMNDTQWLWQPVTFQGFSAKSNCCFIQRGFKHSLLVSSK